jgi:hypothetical protein
MSPKLTSVSTALMSPGSLLLLGTEVAEKSVEVSQDPKIVTDFPRSILAWSIPAWSFSSSDQELRFRPGRSGACEACANSHATVSVTAKFPLSLVAACNLHEVITYLRKWHPDLDILRIEFVAMIEIVSGPPLD